MKATKRIIAVALAVMILALMIPFAASARSGYTAEITGKDGYTITVYQIATYDGAAYVPATGIDATIAAQITKSTGIVPADLLAACETAKKAGNNTGTQSGNALTFGSNNKTTFTTTIEGIYYATVTATPAGVSVKKTGGCVFYLSDALDSNGTSMASQTIDMSAKITVANYNKDSLSYTNKQGVDSTVNGTTVHVYTFDVDLYKVDATDATKKLDGATFTLTMGSNTYTATTANGGKATFTGLKKGTYTLVETNPPKGYNENTTQYTVEVGADGAITSQQYDATLKGVKIGNTPVVMPATGGPGTMMFTIIGASLIACAGILFIVIMRKKKSTK